MKLLYIVNARIPTEKAHGYQIAKMCEAFARAGAEVQVWHSQRRQSPALMHHTVFSYYKVAPVFQVSTVPHWDSAPLERYIPYPLYKIFAFMHACVWGWYAVQKARRLKVDVYYTRDIPIASWLAYFGLPFMYEEHDIPRGVNRMLVRYIIPRSRVTVVVTNAIKERLALLGAPSARVIVAHDAVDLRAFENTPSSQECRSRLSLPQDRFIVGYIGRFEAVGREKGVSNLIQAIGRLPKRINGREIVLVCVGGPLGRAREYQLLARQCGLQNRQLILIDHQLPESVPYWITACDVVTIPWPWTEFSAYYTSPLKLFEYMASGVPIVASDLPSLREIVNENNAVLVQPDDPTALAKGIEKTLSDKQFSGMIAKQARLDVKNHTWDARAREILDAYHSYQRDR